MSAQQPNASPAKTTQAAARSQHALYLIKRFLPYLWPKDAPTLRARVVIAIALLLAAKAAGLAMPFAYKAIIDDMAKPGPDGFTLMLAMLAAYGLARFGQVVFENLRNTIFERVGRRAVSQLALNVFENLHRLSLRFHLERRTGGLSRALDRAADAIDTMLYFLLFNILPTFIELGAVAIIFWVQFGWELVVATAVFVVIYIATTAWITEWRGKLRKQMVEQDTATKSRAIDSLLNFETVKYFNNESYEVSLYRKALKRYENAYVRSENSIAFLNITQSFITNALLILAMAWVGWKYFQGHASVGDVVLVNTLLMQLFRPLDILGWVYREIKQGMIDMEAMLDLLDKEPEIQDAPNAQALIHKGAHIVFDKVVFGYDPRREILHEISFEVPAGKTLAIVGPSGAGKSTISRILYRFYDIQAGRVLIDGQDIRNVTQNSLRKSIGIVPQDTVLFNDSIGYNIRYGDSQANDAAVIAAAQKAQIHDFIAHLPDGYASQVGERGLKLSGGEKQRVAIARTLLKDPPILILDEATSALDTATERDIQGALKAVTENRTTLLIAHRLSTVVDADEIIVLEQGRIVEQGTHTDLLALAGVYAQMWARQQEAGDVLPQQNPTAAMEVL
jgi:ATP-binding cassette, subfamily B, heavy metal transporter